MAVRPLRALAEIAVTRLDGVGPKKAESLEQLDPPITSVLDLLQHYPRRYLDRTNQAEIAHLRLSEEALVLGRVKRVQSRRTRNGKIVLGTASFKEHATVHFWRGQELGFEAREGAMGQLGKLTTVEDLPADFDAMIARAAELSQAPPARKPKHPPKPLPDLHPEFTAALEKAPNAKSAFDAFAPSHRREYLEWIGEAKQDSTRQKRIANAIEWLAEGKPRTWKYA